MSDDVKKSRMKKGVPGYKLRRFFDSIGKDSEEETKPEPKKEKKSRFHLIEQMMKKK